VTTFWKGDIMKRRRIIASSSENKSESSWLPKWLKNLIGPFIVGLMAVTGQLFVNPMAAERVMIKESITQKRYEACEEAIELLQRSIACAKITGKSVPGSYTPPEKTPPTQLEMNAAYIQLLIYNESQTLADEFLAATGPNKFRPNDIVKFVSTVRRELGVDDKDIANFKIRLLFPEGEDTLQDKDAKGLAENE
jgi:hypothetical protein